MAVAAEVLLPERRCRIGAALAVLDERRRRKELLLVVADDEVGNNVLEIKRGATATAAATAADIGTD